MRILWLCNVLLPRIANCINEKSSPYAGWLVGLSDSILAENTDIELIICYPHSRKDLIQGECGKLKYYGFPKSSKPAQRYDSQYEKMFTKILKECSPDIVHIWGTEYTYSLSMIRAFNNPDKTIINIQGLVSIYSQHYFADLPNWIIRKYTFRDFIVHDSIYQQREKINLRGIYEQEAIRSVNHVIGRTDWDRACTNQLNPQINYHFCNETLRESFYNLQNWNINECKRYSIFFSQSSYPIKGFHYLLEALPLVIRQFPKTHVYVAGNNIAKYNKLYDKIKISSYGMFLNKLIKKNKLEKHISFTDNLDELQMKEMYLKSHVFVSSSSIENSPNSIGEAMILGVPTISSDVGGVKNLLEHNKDGFIYQHNAPYMLAYYISEIFGNDQLAQKFSENSRNHAKQTHNRDTNLKTIIGIYTELLK